MDSNSEFGGGADFKSTLAVAGICSFASDINVAGTSYLNGKAVVNGKTTFNGDIQVNGETRLSTNPSSDVAIVDYAGVDTMRINDAGNITLNKAGVVFTSSNTGSAGLYINALSNSPIALFQANANVYFYGPSFNALHINATSGLLVNAGTNVLNVSTTNTSITGPTIVTGSLNCGALTASSISTSADFPFTNATQTNILCQKSLVLGQTGDTFGSATRPLQNRNGLGGALFQTQNTDSSVTLVDFGFLMTNGVQRNLRLEGRASYARAGSPSFVLGGSDLTAPTLAVGDTYGTITKLAVGSYTTPGTNALSVTGTASIRVFSFVRE